MKKKNLITLISLLLVTAFVLAACGGGETETPAAEPLVPEETAVAEPSDEETGEETADETELTLTVWVDEKQFDVIDGMVDEFKNEYGVTIIIEQLGFGDLQTQFLIAAPAGEGPDVMATAHNTLGEIVSNGLVAPIELGNSEADYTPASIQAWKYNGELYGLPYSTENVGFFINQDIVPGCPATWTEVMEISQEISADNDDDLETNKYGFVRMESDPYHFFPIMTAFGGYVFGMTDQGYDPSDVGLDSEETLAAAAFWDDYIKQGLQPAGVDNTNMMDIFESGQSAMTITGPWFTQRVKDSGINYAICPIPGKVSEFGQPFMGSFGFVISAFSENPLLAEIFVKEFLNSEETMRALYDATPQVPAHLAVLETLDDVDLVAYGKAGLSAVPMPAIPEMGSVWEAWANAITLVSQQTDDPANAFSNAAEQIRTAISGGGAAEEPEAGPVEIEMVNIPGTAQAAIGCDADWDPACEVTALTLEPNDKWMGTFEVPAGDYEVKAAINGGWDINYGVDGAAGGDNIMYSLAADGFVIYVFDPVTNLLVVAPMDMVNIPGTAQEAIGCGGNWDPACEASALAQGDDGLWTGTFELPAGDHEVKAAINGGWDINYGVDGAVNGDNLTFSLDADSTVTFTFDPVSNLLAIVIE